MAQAKPFDRHSYIKGVMTVLAVLVIVLTAGGWYVFNKAFSPLKPAQLIEILENEGLTQVSVELRDAQHAPQGSFRFTGKVASNLDCVVAGDTSNGGDTLYYVDKYQPNWYPVLDQAAKGNWPPDYVTLGQLAAEHPEVCQ